MALLLCAIEAKNVHWSGYPVFIRAKIVNGLTLKHSFAIQIGSDVGRNFFPIHTMFE